MKKTRSRSGVRRAAVLTSASLLAGRRLARRQLDRARRASDWTVLRPGFGRPSIVHRVCAEDGVELTVYESGVADASTTVVLLHGWTLSSEIWDSVAQELGSSLRVLRVDHRGHGRSERGPEWGLTMDQLGRDVGAVLDKLVPEGHVVLAGHSMGGMTIMHLAAQRPEQFGSRVRGVVLVATSIGDLANLDLGLPWPLARVVQRYGSSALRRLAALESRMSPVGPVPAELWFAVRSLNYGPGVPARHVDDMIRVVRRTPLGVVSAFYAALLQHDGARGIPGLLKVPVAILVGDSDRLTPVSHANKIAAHLPEASLKVIPDVGHMIVQECPEVVASVVRELVPQSKGLELIASGAR